MRISSKRRFSVLIGFAMAGARRWPRSEMPTGCAQTARLPAMLHLQYRKASKNTDFRHHGANTAGAIPPYFQATYDESLQGRRTIHNSSVRPPLRAPRRSVRQPVHPKGRDSAGSCSGPTALPGFGFQVAGISPNQRARPFVDGDRTFSIRAHRQTRDARAQSIPPASRPSR